MNPEPGPATAPADLFAMNCPHCGEQVDIPTSLRRQDVACPMCEKQFRAEVKPGGFAPPPTAFQPKIAPANAKTQGRAMPKEPNIWPVLTILVVLIGGALVYAALHAGLDAVPMAIETFLKPALALLILVWFIWWMVSIQRTLKKIEENTRP